MADTLSSSGSQHSQIALRVATGHITRQSGCRHAERATSDNDTNNNPAAETVDACRKHCHRAE